SPVNVLSQSSGPTVGRSRRRYASAFARPECFVTGDVLEFADRLWRGEADAAGLITVSNELTEVADRTGCVWSMSNVSAFGVDGGVVLVDTGSAFMAGNIHGAVRGWTREPVTDAIYSHGHIDHVFGILAFEA